MSTEGVLVPDRLKVLYLHFPGPDKLPEFRIAVVDAVADRHDLAIFDHSRPIQQQFDGVDVVIDLGGSVGTREMADAAGDARLWQVLGYGMDHFDLDYWKSKRIPVAHCPGPMHAVALAEFALMLMLMLSRQYPTARANLEAGNMYEPVGLELEDRRLAVVGFGATGRELTRRAKSFGMKVLAIDIAEISGEETDDYGLDLAGTPHDLDLALREADYVSLHLPLNDETRHIIDDRRLRLMKPAAFLINVSRGGLVDEEALAAALLEGRLGGAGLDVFTREPPDMASALITLPNVVATPHVSGGTDGTARRRAAAAAENIDRIAQGREPLFLVG